MVTGVGVQVYDTLNPIEPTLVATIPIQTALRVEHWGIHLFVAAGEEGLFVVDVGNHQSPSIIGSVVGINAAADLRLYAHHQAGPDFAARAYVADPSFGVRVVDLLPNFSAPTLVSGIPLPSGALGLDTYTRYIEATATTSSLERDFLYVAAGTKGVSVFDISDPDDIRLASRIQNLGGSVSDIDAFSQIAPPGVDDYAVVANDTKGLQVLDISNPQAISLVHATNTVGLSRVFAEVFQLDRYVDEQGNELIENSHEGARPFSHEELVRLLRVTLTR